MKEGKFRVSRVTTRTGDKGTSGLANGERLPKHHIRFELLGTLDELNSAIGYLRSQQPGAIYEDAIEDIQQTLFNLGSEVANPGQAHVTDADVKRLEAASAHFNEALPPLREFVLPGGSPLAAWCHVCRATARRAERCLSAVAAEGFANEASLAWLNRLSDLLFILSRRLNTDAGVKEPQWHGPLSSD